jgi:hypothetical protein
LPQQCVRRQVRRPRRLAVRTRVVV